jgi:hypothetical protein
MTSGLSARMCIRLWLSFFSTNTLLAFFSGMTLQWCLLPVYTPCRYDIESVSAQVDDFVADLSFSLASFRSCGQLQYLLSIVRDTANTMNASAVQGAPMEGLSLQSLPRLQVKEALAWRVGVADQHHCYTSFLRAHSGP